MLSRQSSFILEKSVISSSSSFLSFSYLQYVHQSSSNESGLIRWAVHSDLISVILSKISVNQNVTSSSSNFFKVQNIKWTVHSDLIFGILVINICQSKCYQIKFKSLVSWNNVWLLRKLKMHRIIRKTKRRQIRMNDYVQLLLSTKMLKSFQIVTEMLYATEVFSFLQ